MPKGFKGFQKGNKVNLGIKFSEEHRRKMSENNKPPSRIGTHHSEETKRKIGLANKGKPSPMKGKQQTEEAKKKISEAKKGHTGFYKGKKFSKEHKKKISLAHIGMKASPETKRKLSLLRVKFPIKRKDTSIELKLENELRRQSIPFIKQAPVEGVALVDFLLPNKIIVQADGKYWHRKEHNRGKDIVQDTILGFKGYTIFRFTETEINKSAKRCINKIIKAGAIR